MSSFQLRLIPTEKGSIAKMTDEPRMNVPEEVSLPNEAADVPQAECEDADAINRRRLISRYGRYAVVGIPLLLFSSKAHAVHSKP
jgi:hypothetical protein